MTHEENNYSVGYSKPPRSTQFKKGQSGNPLGRPKGSKNKSIKSDKLRSIILEEAYRGITVNDGDKRLNIPIIRACLRSLTMKAAKGHLPSQRLLLNLAKQAEHEQLEEKHDFLKVMIEYVDFFEYEIKFAQQHGFGDLDPIPHPNHILISSTGEVKFTGPTDEQQKSRWDRVVKYKFSLLEEINYLQNALKDEGEKEFHDMYRKDLKFHVEQLEKVKQAIPDDTYIPPSTIKYIRENFSKPIFEDKNQHLELALKLSEEQKLQNS